MKKDLTELVIILDMSGSMEALTDDTIGGFNSILREQTDREGEVLVTTYLFNGTSRMLHDRVPIAQVPQMTRQDYRACGNTALIDAIGGAIRHIAGIHRYARPEDVPEQTLFVITTDGMENASRSFTADEVRQMIRHEEEKYGWEFSFLAANIDAVSTAERIGIMKDRAVDYRHDTLGTEAAYKTINMAIRNVRGKKRLHEDLDWRKDADEDFLNRS